MQSAIIAAVPVITGRLVVNAESAWTAVSLSSDLDRHYGPSRLRVNDDDGRDHAALAQ